MKRAFFLSAIILLVSMLCICQMGFVSAESGSDTEKWYTSNDEIISFAVTAVDNSAYPKISITMKYKTDTGNTKREPGHMMRLPQSANMSVHIPPTRIGESGSRLRL